MRRVVITGAGTINALGADVTTTLAALREGRCGIGPLGIEDADKLQAPIGAQVQGFDPYARFDRAKLPLYDRYTQFALVAAREAVAQSGLGEFGARAGVILGTSGGGLTTQDESYRAVYQDNRPRVHPFTVPKLMNNAAAAHVAMTHDLRGPSFTVSTACASSNHAIAQAAAMIRGGAADIMLTGGSEAMLCFGGIKAWEGLRVMSKTGCRPFCATRDGMVQGEGAAVFVLESHDHARGRGADILAEISGFAMNCDASDIVMPNARGAVAAMHGALNDAQINAGDIGYINAHGTGTAANDRTESAAIRDVFATPPPTSSTKAAHGHAIGATSAIEALACIMALRDGVVAPTIGHKQSDPDCLNDIISGAARQVSVNYALSNAFAFGGQNAAVIFGKV